MEMQRIDIYYIEAGESQKNLDTVKMIYEKLILAKFDRKVFWWLLGAA